MNIVRDFVSFVIRVWTGIVCRIELEPLAKVPMHGPLILTVNHITSLEVPLLFAYLQPRKMIGLAKIETWDNKFMAWLFDLWEAIPIRRGEADLDAIRACLKVLAAGDMLGVAPEGTRSYSGRLQRGQPGIAMIALRSGAPIQPIAHWGGEDLQANLKRFKRTPFHIRVGKPFVLHAGDVKVNGEIRQAMADEIMYQIALLLPPDYRGDYSDCESFVPKYIHFV